MTARDEALTALAALREEIDREAGALHARHRARLKCGRGCAQCCVDELSVFEVEAESIRERHGELLSRGAPHAPGACAFLDAAGACRIYEDRPYVCRTQGLPLRWVEPELNAEQRDICPLNEAGEPIEELPEHDCWTLGPVEGRLAAIQADWDGGALRRVSLRSLFSREADVAE